jgi:hypothetical protein
MKGAQMGRGLGAILTVLAVGLLTLVIPAARGASAKAAVSLQATNACGSKIGAPARVGGVISAVSVDARCVRSTDNAARGLPPLIWHNGAVMGTTSTGPVVVTPIFWHPPGHPMASNYESIISKYLADVAAASGSNTNVFSTLTDYFGTDGAINYQVQEGTPIDDTNPLPADGCNLTRKDTSGIYADGSGYDACIDDAQVIAETANVVKANSLPVNLSHMYVLFVPKHVEMCFLGGSTGTVRQGNQACTINHEKSAGYCAYHSMAPNRMVYANLSFPIYHSPVGFTCGSDARIAFRVIETPNGDPDADTELSATSHEIMEAITDPDVNTGWYDAAGFENGDECAFVYGTPQGAAGTFFNQVINGDHYLTQEEFSNLDFFNTGLGCLQHE